MFVECGEEEALPTINGQIVCLIRNKIGIFIEKIFLQFRIKIKILYLGFEIVKKKSKTIISIENDMSIRSDYEMGKNTINLCSKH